MGTSVSLPSTRITAVLGARPISFLMAWEVLPLEAASRLLPSRIRAMITAAVSKYSSSAAMNWPIAMRTVEARL